MVIAFSRPPPGAVDGADPDLAEQAGPPAGNLAKQLRDQPAAGSRPRSLVGRHLPSLGTRDQCPPMARRISPSWASRLSPFLAVAGAAANRGPARAADPWPGRLLQSHEDGIGVLTPTKPEVATMSPGRTIATASAALTPCHAPACSRCSAVAPSQPVDDPPADDALRLAGDEHADMPARYRARYSRRCRPCSSARDVGGGTM